MLFAVLLNKQGFHLTDAEGDSVVLSASIPDGTALSLTKLQIQRAPPPVPTSADGTGADAVAGGDGDEDSGDAADADEGKKKCCVVM
jgi:hypothetical protein|eukprot:COSAG03_NODE_379_length_8384_cov_1.929028_6_plen_87_part_00